MSDKVIAQMLFWFQLIGAVGSLATFGAFVFLFFKDKNKEKQLDRLTTIARSQQEIVEAMQEEIGEIKLQTKYMSEANELQALQFAHQVKTDEHILAESKLKRRNEIKPYFLKTSFSASAPNFNLGMTNRGGGPASNLQYETESKEFFISHKVNHPQVRKDHTATVTVTSTDVKQLSDVQGVVMMTYTDEDGNSYSQKLMVKSATIEVANPTLVALAP